MPKIVDHEARRAQIAEAVWRIAADRGLGAASLREVAAEAGWSLGALRHYFATREDLLRFGFRLAAQRAYARIEQATAGAGSARDALQAALEETLPLDEERRSELRVWLAFFVHADVSAELKGERDATYATIIGWLAGFLERLERPPADPPGTAVLLWAAIDGIALQGLARPETMTPARQRAALDAQLELLLGD
jgi:AcrR family transcriptional regulator